MKTDDPARGRSKGGASAPLTPLRPQEIGWVFGRQWPGAPSWLERIAPKQRRWVASLPPVPRASLVAAGLIALTLAVGGADRVLVGSSSKPSVMSVVLGHHLRDGESLELPLLHDPAGIVFLLVSFLTPLFCALQVTSIRQFNPANEHNYLLMFHTLTKRAELEQLVVRANNAFQYIGSKRLSAALLALASGITYGVNTQFSHGLYRSWNNTNLSSRKWSEQIYGAWWANSERHTLCAALLFGTGTFFLYFLFKQLAMGFVFADYARGAATHGFGVTPCLSHNPDGFYGLRPLRRFMQWTYGSTVAHFITTLAMFVLWLPLGQVTVIVICLVAAANIATVVYPSMLAYRHSITIKDEYAAKLLAESGRPQRPPAAVRAEIDAAWAQPALPFRTRSTFGALALYLFAPLILLLVQASLGK